MVEHDLVKKVGKYKKLGKTGKESEVSKTQLEKTFGSKFFTT